MDAVLEAEVMLAKAAKSESQSAAAGMSSSLAAPQTTNEDNDSIIAVKDGRVYNNQLSKQAAAAGYKLPQNPNSQMHSAAARGRGDT